MDEVWNVKILDHGYVKLIETWGSDQRIVEAARMSTDKGFSGWGRQPYYECPKCNYEITVSLIPHEKRDHVICGTGSPRHELETVEMKLVTPEPGDEKLLRYLYEHKHDTPFEMAGMIIEVQAPIIVFREWHRHRTQSYNEMSGRYTVLPDLYYVPSIERLKHSYQDTKNKQSSDVAPWDDFQLNLLQEAFRQSQIAARAQYNELLGSGVAREVARLVLPVSQYSRMRASANLRNWLAFLTLRQDKAAQYEIRRYAEVVGTFISRSFPRTWDLFSRTETGKRKLV